MEKSLLNELLKRPIAYQPIVAKAFDSVKLGILWSQLFYWHDKCKDPDGWIYKTRIDIYDETGLSRKEQETARDLGKKLEILEEKIAGYPKKTHFKINIEKAYEIILRFIEQQNKGQQQLAKDFGKKIKTENSIAYLRDLPNDDIKELAEKYQVDEKFIKDRAGDVVDYCEAKGKKYSNYKAALRNFIKMHLDRHPEIRNAFVSDKQRKEAEKKLQKQLADTKRTPEEQARINKKLAALKGQLANNFTAK